MLLPVLFLLLAIFLAINLTIVSSNVHEWVAFDFFNDDLCSLEIVYRHGVRVGVCQREREFLSLWSNSTTRTGMDIHSLTERASFRVDRAGQSVNASLWLRLFGDADCEQSSLLAEQEIAAPAELQQLNSSSLSDEVLGEWPLGGCELTRDGQHWTQWNLFRESIRVPPVGRFYGKFYEYMTYFEPEGDVCTDEQSVPGNFSTFMLSECVSTSEHSSFIAQCSVDYETTLTVFPSSNNCSGESFVEVIPSTCPETPSRFLPLPFFPGTNESTNQTDLFPLQVDRFRCSLGRRDNDWWTPVEEESSPPSFAPTQRAFSQISLMFSFSLSDVMNDSYSLRDTFFDLDAEQLVCEALNIDLHNCVCGPSCFSFSPQDNLTPMSHDHILPVNDSLVCFTASVNVTLHTVDYSSLSYNESWIISHATSVLSNISESAAWENFFSSAVTSRTTTFSPSTQLVHTSVAVAGISPPPNFGQSVNSFAPSLSPTSSPQSGREKQSLTSNQVLLVSMVVAVAFVQVIGVYMCFFRANKKFSAVQPETLPS